MKKLLLIAVATLSFAFADDIASASRAFGYRLGEAAANAYELDIEALLGGYEDFINHKPFPITATTQPDAEIGFAALGYIIGQSLDLSLNADHYNILQGVRDALAGENSPAEDTELIYSLFKPEYCQLAQNLQIAIPFLTQLDDDLQK